MFKILALATLATVATNTPNISFTKDSVYTKSKIVTCEVIEVKNQETEETTKYLSITENQHLGYTIYDKEETSYIDGIKVDGEWVTDWVVPNYDDSIEHTILIKTVYSDDVAGMLMAAKNGDWTRLLSNPLILFKAFYYLLAAISIITGGVGLLKIRKYKVKTADSYGKTLKNTFTSSVDVMSTAFENTAIGYVDNMIVPFVGYVQARNKDMISAFILSQAGDEKSKIALLDMFNKNTDQDIIDLTNQVKDAIRNNSLSKQVSKTEAFKVIDNIAKGNNVTSNDITKATTDNSNSGGGIKI